MKRIARIVVVTGAAIALSLSLAGCGQGSSDQPTQDQSSQEEVAEPLDLTGTWDQVNATGDTTMQAVIKGDTITINWITNGGDSKSLYWKGTYVAPEEAVESYSWTSEGDTEEMSTALLASTDDAKDFAYADGQLTYEASAMGTTTTVRLEKAE